jgi:integrase
MAVYRPKYRELKTGEVRQCQTWWFDFLFAGRRVRESAKTTRKTLAVEAEKRRRLELERAYAGLPSEEPSKRVSTVGELLKTYQNSYRVNHRPKSIAWVKERAAHVARLLGGVLVSDLTEERVRGYMEARLEKGLGHRTVNMELLCLSRALGHTWRELWPKMRRLEEPTDTGRALSEGEERAILEAAARSKSRLIYPYLVTLLWTGLRSDEARLLRWCQVDFEAGQVVVGRAKSEAGSGRLIPMSATLRAVLEHHAAWYSGEFGLLQPGWYVFPGCSRARPVEAARAVASMKRAWETVRKAAGVQCRLHDLRHTFCTKMAEAGVPEATMLDMMGHVSAVMLRRYSHIRAKARREAIDALEAHSVSFGHVKESPKVDRFGVAESTVTH